jgi:mRNA-degrading endonuclease RelE of RelBE toxin-antitoxin system
MQWTVTTRQKVKKKLNKLPGNLIAALVALIRDIEKLGPVRGNWPNYSRLGGNRHHCHLKKGKTTYVAVWKVINNEIRIVEVYYVGTHEKAPY